MNRSERSDVPFVPSQIAQPEGGTIITLPSVPRLNAECGANQAITVLAGVSGVFAPDIAMIMTFALTSPSRSMPAPDFGRCDGYHRRVDCIRVQMRIPRRSPTAVAAHRSYCGSSTQPPPTHENATLEAIVTEASQTLCSFGMPALVICVK
jgi:hypothetical protein